MRYVDRSQLVIKRDRGWMISGFLCLHDCKGENQNEIWIGFTCFALPRPAMSRHCTLGRVSNTSAKMTSLSFPSLALLLAGADFEETSGFATFWEAGLTETGGSCLVTRVALVTGWLLLGIAVPKSLSLCAKTC